MVHLFLRPLLALRGGTILDLTREAPEVAAQRARGIVVSNALLREAAIGLMNYFSSESRCIMSQYLFGSIFLLMGLL